MLNTDKRKATLRNINIRTQRHGKDKVRAMDLKFSFQLTSEELDAVSPGFREMLYRKPSTGDQMELAPDAPNAYTVLRKPDIEPIKMKGKFPGYEVTIRDDVPEDTPPDQQSELFLLDVTLQGLTIEPHEGGTVDLIVTASVPFDSQELADASEYLVEDSVLLTLDPPSKSESVRPDTGTIEQGAAPEALH